VGIYCWRQFHTEVSFNNKSGQIYQISELFLLTELGRTVSTERARFSRQLDTDFKEDFCAGFVR
jgi:hypothetical protein